MTTGDYEPSPLAAAHAEPGDHDTWTLVFVRDIRHAPSRVWAALTDPEQLATWSPFVPDRPLHTPGPLVLRMQDGDTVDESPGVISIADEPRLLEYSWGEDRLRWELVSTAGGTRLTLRHTVHGGELVPKVAAGWHICLDVAERALDGTPVGPIIGMAAMDHGWQELHDAYAARFDVTAG